MNYSVDIETALHKALTAAGYSASAHVIPAGLERRLPHIHVTRTGGYTDDIVIDVNSVDFDVYARTAPDAMEMATRLTGWVRDLAGRNLETPCYRSEVTTLPYHNPDPLHPNIGRATIKALIRIRTKGGN